MITLRLPFPPTANHYNAIAVRGGKPMVYRTEKAKVFYQEVADIVRDQFGEPPMIEERLSVVIELKAPDNYRRDVSNYAKCVEDALTEAGLYMDDSQIDSLTIRRGGKDPNKVGWAIVTIEPEVELLLWEKA